jgi:hypothetical protein
LSAATASDKLLKRYITAVPAGRSVFHLASPLIGLLVQVIASFAWTVAMGLLPSVGRERPNERYVEYIEIQNNARRVVRPWVMGAGSKRRCFLSKCFPAI